MDGIELGARLVALVFSAYEANCAVRRSRQAATEIRELANGVSSHVIAEGRDIALPEHEPQAVPTLQQLQITSKGKECRPCTADHIATCAGILSEALRFARSDGMESDEVQQRLALCAQEMNTWERWDAAPPSFEALSDADKAFLRRWLPKGRKFRHEVNKVDTIEDLEKAAANAQRLHLEARKELKTGRKSPLAEKFWVEMGEHFMESSNSTLEEEQV